MLSSLAGMGLIMLAKPGSEAEAQVTDPPDANWVPVFYANMYLNHAVIAESLYEGDSPEVAKQKGEMRPIIDEIAVRWGTKARGEFVRTLQSLVHRFLLRQEEYTRFRDGRVWAVEVKEMPTWHCKAVKKLNQAFRARLLTVCERFKISLKDLGVDTHTYVPEFEPAFINKEFCALAFQDGARVADLGSRVMPKRVQAWIRRSLKDEQTHGG